MITLTSAMCQDISRVIFEYYMKELYESPYKFD